MPILDVAIALFFLYLTITLIVSFFQEAMASFTRSRARALRNSIGALLSYDGKPKESSAAEDLIAAEGDGAAKESGAAENSGAETLLKELYDHPLITTLRPVSILPARVRTFVPGSTIDDNGQLDPSYMPATAFIAALLDTLKQKANATKHERDADDHPITGNNYANAIQIIAYGLDKNHHLRKALTVVLETSGPTEPERKKALEDWFDQVMERASGAYKRRTQVCTFT